MPTAELPVKVARGCVFAEEPLCSSFPSPPFRLSTATVFADVRGGGGGGDATTTCDDGENGETCSSSDRHPSV